MKFLPAKNVDDSGGTTAPVLDQKILNCSDIRIIFASVETAF